MHRRQKSIISAMNGAAGEVSTSLFPLTKLDALLVEQYRRFHPTISHSGSDSTSSPEEHELERVQRIMRNIRNKQSLNMIIDQLSSTTFPLIIDRIRTFFLDFLLRPFEILERTSDSNQLDQHTHYIIVITEFHRALPYFKQADQIELLEALANLILLFAPDINSSRKCPSFDIYASACSACENALKICISNKFPQNLLLVFVKQVLSNAITIAINVAAVARANHNGLSSNAGYVGELLPFIATIEPLMSANDQEVLRMLQQFWIASVLFSLSISALFTQWNDALDRVARFLPPLIQKTTKIDFSSVKFRVKELLELIKPEQMKKTEDVLPLFSNLLKNVNTKVILQLEIADAVYALSIYVLELTRAERGIVGPIFDYIEIEYNPAFSQILDEMFDPIFVAFSKYLGEVPDVERRSSSMSYTMSVLISRYGSPNPRIRQRVDQYLQKFGSLNKNVMCSGQVLNSIAHVEIAPEQVIPNRAQMFEEIMTEFFSKAIKSAPYTFIAALHHQIFKDVEVDYIASLPSYVSTFQARLPTKEYKDSFMNELIKKAIIVGKASYVTPEQIEKCKDPNDKLLLTAAYIIKHKDFKMLDLLCVKAQSKVLMISWSVVAIYSIDFSKAIISKTIDAFIRLAEENQGIYGTSIDIETIEYQTCILRFLVEQITIERHFADYISIITATFNNKILNNPCVVPALLPLACLGVCVLASPYPMSLHATLDLQIYVIRVIFLAFSYTCDSTVYKYITPSDITYIDFIMMNLQDTVDLSNKRVSGEPTNRSESLSTSAMLFSNSSTFSTGKISKQILSSAFKSQLNFNDSNAQDHSSISILAQIATYLLGEQYQNFTAFLGLKLPPHIQRALALTQIKPRKMHLSTIIKILWRIAPECLYSLCILPRIGKLVTDIIFRLAQKDVYQLANVPNLALVFAKIDSFPKATLAIWKNIPTISTLTILTADIMKERQSASYVARCFENFTREESLLFLPQLVQSLRFDQCCVLYNFLLAFSRTSEVFRHYLLWNILSEKENYVNEHDTLPGILKRLEKELIDAMTPTEKIEYEAEFGFIDALDLVSQKLLKLNIEERPPALCDELNAMEIPSNLYIPSNPNYKIISIDSEHSVPLKSHARVPILVRFQVYDENDPEHKPIPFSCIFKIQDDVRQDAMMIQFIDRCKNIFIEAGIDCFLLPYRVFATGKDRGVIECISNAKSRHDLGRATTEHLLPYFISQYGQVGTPGFQKAQDNFIKSMAPYSLICYLFQVKDRHNANIMIDDVGHVIHIDFGFIFEISPGGNMKFERAPFKLTHEMIELMGGSKAAPAFMKFIDILTKCFFAVRARHEEIEAITYLMMSCGFPCFRADSIKNLQQRLYLEKSPKEVVTEIDKLIDASYESMSSTAYDAFQSAQNKIYF